MENSVRTITLNRDVVFSLVKGFFFTVVFMIAIHFLSPWKNYHNVEPGPLDLEPVYVGTYTTTFLGCHHFNNFTEYKREDERVSLGWRAFHSFQDAFTGHALAFFLFFLLFSSSIYISKRFRFRLA